MTDQFLEYARVHLISLEQDLANLQVEMSQWDEDSGEFMDLDLEYNHVAGMILATQHLLTVYADILYNEKKEGN